MSRSALEKNAQRAQLRQPVQTNSAPQFMGAAQAPFGYPMMMPNQMYTMEMMNAYYPMQPQVYAPIRLTGDEDDNDDPENRKTIPQHGSSSTFNINTMLYNNIVESEYFIALYPLLTHRDVINEIYNSVKHVEPWQTGTARLPSSAFCLLYKLMVLKLTFKQMEGILQTEDNPFVRAIGFLYLRYTCPPADLWKWFEPYLEDEEEISPTSDTSVTMTVGAYCIKLLTDMQYFGTTLPRIPVLIERNFKVLLLLLQEKQKRRSTNKKIQRQFKVGAKVRAIYSDKDNEPAWYDAEITSCEEDDRYWVTFPEYGNNESVELGDMELLDVSASSAGGVGANHSLDKKDKDSKREHRDDDTHHSVSGPAGNKDNRERSRSRSCDRGSKSHRESRSRSRDRDNRGGGGARGSTENLLEKVLQNERNASAAVGRNYGQRPTSYKGSLSLKLDRYTVRKQSPERNTSGHRDRDRDRDREGRRGRSNSRSPQRHGTGGGAGAGSGSGGSGSSSATTAAPAMSHEQLQRMKNLRDRYGDASIAGAK